MTDNINLADVQPVGQTTSYIYNLRLEEFNGKCRIVYSTNSPLLCMGTINLCSTDGPKIIEFETANPYGGLFDTDQPWGSGWYAQWNAKDVENKWVALAFSPITA